MCSGFGASFDDYVGRILRLHRTSSAPIVQYDKDSAVLYGKLQITNVTIRIISYKVKYVYTGINLIIVERVR